MPQTPIPTQTKFLKEYSKLLKYTLAVFVLGLFSVSLMSSPVALVDAATTVGVSNTTVVPQGLVGYWTFDGKNMTNATATDISGYGVNGTLKNMTTAGSAIPGKMGQALKFNGVNNYIDLGPSAVDNSIYSISLWVYNYGSTTGQVLIHGNGYSYCFYNPSIYMGNGTISVAETGCAGGGTIGSKALTKGWHHAVITRNGQNAIFYVDGVVVATDNSNNGGNPAQGVLIFGASPSNPSGSTVTSYFDGALDDVRIYNRAITPNEVQTLYKAGGGTLTATAPGTSNISSLNSGLAGYWTFDGKNMTNATATDLSGNSNDGTLNAMTKMSSSAAGKLGQALTFNGGTQGVTVGTSSTINDMSQFTLSAWIKPESMGGSNTGRILDKTNNTTPSIGWSLQLNDPTNFRFQFVIACTSGGTIRRISANQSLKLNKWTHIAVVWDGTTTSTSVRLFIDGTETPYYLSQSCLGTKLSDAAQALVIGNNSTGIRGFDGPIDDVRVYNRQLSPSEISSLYKNGQAVTTYSPTNNNATGINSGLLGYWPFDGKYMTNATATDASGQGNNGTLTNMTTRTNAALGKIGQALTFNGSNNYFTFPTISLTAFAFSFWTKTTNTSQIGMIIGDSSAGSGAGSKIGFSGGNIFLRAGGGQYTVASMPTDGKWHHWVITRDQSNSWTLYKDAVATNIGSSPGSSTYNVNTIGANGGDKSQLWNGNLDDVRIYNRALSVSEVRALYKLGGGR